MSFGKKKSSSVKYKAPASQFAGVTGSSFNGPFGSATSNRNGSSIDTTFKLGDSFAGLPDTIGQGLSSNYRYLGQDPQQRYDSILGGNDPVYNLLREQTDRELSRQLGRAKLTGQSTGNVNSTALGALNAGILNDGVMRNNQNILSALDYGNSAATNAINTGLGGVTTLNNLIAPLGSAANANLMTAMTNQDQVALANAARQLQADQFNAQASMANQGSSPWGTIGSLAGAALGLGLAPFTGGSSLALASLGGSLGGGVGSLFGGGKSAASPSLGAGLSASSLPSYAPIYQQAPFLGGTGSLTQSFA